MAPKPKTETLEVAVEDVATTGPVNLDQDTDAEYVEAIDKAVKEAAFNEILAENQAADKETSRKLALLSSLATKSSIVSWENNGTHGIDGEMLVSLRMTVKEYNGLREILTALRGEFQKTI